MEVDKVKTTLEAFINSEEGQEVVKTIKKKKTDPVGIAYYGETFEGYQKIAEYKDLLPAFKDFYYEIKIRTPNHTIALLMKNFNSEVCVPLGRKFHPYPTQLKLWRKKWDLDIMQQKEDTDLQIVEKKNIRQIVKTRNGERAIDIGLMREDELEAGVRTLGGELLNDAMQILSDDQQLEEIYDADVLIKRRNYVVNVFGHVTKLVHGKATLMLKASQEKRENASFLMTLLAKASSGKLSDGELDLLKNNHRPNEQPTP